MDTFDVGEARRARAVLRGALTKTQNLLSNQEHFTIREVNVRMQYLTDILQKFQELQTNIELEMEEEDIDDEMEYRYDFEETTIQLKVKLLVLKNNQSHQSASSNINDPPPLITSIQDEDVATKIIQNNQTLTITEQITTEQKQKMENFKGDATQCSLNSNKIQITDTDLTNKTDTEDNTNNQFRLNSFNVPAESLSDIHSPRTDSLYKITLEINSETVKMKFDTGDVEAILKRNWMKEIKSGLANVKEEGDRVQALNYSYPIEKWKFGIGAERLGRLHYRVTTDGGESESWRRHADQMLSAAGVPPAD